MEWIVPGLQQVTHCLPIALPYRNSTAMNTPRILILGIASFVLAASANAQTTPPAKPATGAPVGAPAKAKPFSPADTKIYIIIAEGMQFHLKASERLRGRMKDGDPALVAFAGKIGKEMTDIFTPGVTMAQEHGVPGLADKKSKTGTIPNEMTPADKAALAKVDAMNKDEKKWPVAFFELFAKESKKNAADAEKGAKAAQDPDLKAFAEKAAAALKSQAETIEAKHKELKAKK